MMMELLNHLPSPQIAIVSTLFCVLMSLKIIFSIDDLIAKKFNNTFYVRSSLKFISTCFKKILHQIREVMKLPEDIQPIQINPPRSLIVMGYYFESFLWFFMSIFMLTYWLLIFIMTVSTFGHVAIYKSLLAILFNIVLIGCSRFFYVESRRSLARAKSV